MGELSVRASKAREIAALKGPAVNSPPGRGANEPSQDPLASERSGNYWFGTDPA